MAETESAQPNVPFFKKRTKARATTTRKRSVSPSSGEPSSHAVAPPSVSEVVLPTKKNTSSLLTQGTKRKKLPDESTSLDGPDVNWSSAGSRARLEAGMELEAEEIERVEEELRRKRRRDENGGYDPDEDAMEAKDGEYKGQAGYQKMIKKKQEVPKAARVGPQRSNNTIRTVTMMDYQPDVCKDYKETGFCGFGDTCKFLHDRGTYLQGWQLDKLAEKASKQAANADESDSDSDEEDIPWACFICRKPYTDPIVTRCGHYFCSACAIKRFAKTPKCAACGQPTGGIFNRADKVVEKMREKKKAEEEAAGSENDGAAGGNVKVEGLEDGSDAESD
ncbi:RNA-splicing factor [Tulasnella sp. 419]|nr:RNA-splicing factor [Tulasnella sp. 419]